MGILIDANAEYLSVAAVGPGSVGLTNFTIWGWHRRTSGVGTGLVDSSCIFSQEGNASKFNALGFDNTSDGGVTEAGPRLCQYDADSSSPFSANDHPAFDTWWFFVVVASGSAGAVTVTAYYSSDGTVWYSSANASTTANTVTATRLLIGMPFAAAAAPDNGSPGDYAYFGARAEAMTAADAKNLIYRSATAAGDWGYWRLLNSTTLTDSSGNARDLSMTGTITNGADPTIPPQIIMPQNSLPTLGPGTYQRIMTALF